MSHRWLLLLCSVVLLVSSLALGQGTTSRISGVVTDSSGAIVSNATVTAVNEGTGATYAMKSSSAGTYAFDLLQVGRYTIKAEAVGFKQFVSTGNVLAIGVPTSVNPKLEIGGNTETVTVQGGYDLVQTESSGNLGGIIDNVTLTQLPIVGTRQRNPVGLVQYMPGVVLNGLNATGGGINVNGSRDRAWNYVMDGIDANESSSGGGNTSPPHQNPDMLSEFRVITASPTAEFGRSSGAQVVMVTKSGTNQWHGNLFWFYQSPFLRANSPQNKATTPITPKSQFVQNIPGASLGGPIWKDKAFFFANFELLHAATSTLLTRTVYTQQARQGLFRYASSGRNQPAGVTGASVDGNGNPIVPYNTYDMVANDPFHKGLDPAMQSYLGLSPLPNNFQAGDGLNFAGYNFVAPSTDKQVDVAFKIDYRFNEKNSVYFRWLGGHQNTYADPANAGYSTFPGLPAVVNTYRTPRNFAFNWRWAPTPKLANEFVVGMNRFGYKFENPSSAANAKQPFVTTLVTSPLISALGNNRFLTTFQLVDNVTYVHGPHIFKGGINFRYGREIDQRGSVGVLNAIPQVTFSTGTSGNTPDTTAYKIPQTGINTSNDQTNLYTAINELLGRVGQLQEGYVAQPDLNAFKPAGTINNMDHRWPEYDFYIQDTWHALPNLVLDFGIRVDGRQAPDLHSFPGLIPNQSLNYGTPLTSALQFVHGSFMSNRWTNFGPSAGFAWDPMKDGKTSIRGNFRIAYDRINPFSFSSSVFQGMPGLTYQVTDATSGLDQAGAQGVRAANWFVPSPTATPLSLTTPPAYGAGSLTVGDPNMQTPTVSMWALSIQRELVKNTVLTVSYIGNHGTHLYGGYDTNQSEIFSNGFLDAFKQVQAGQDSQLMTNIISSDTRRRTNESGTAFIQRNYASNLTLNNVAGLANSLATRLQTATGYPNGKPLVVSSGLPANFFKPYSQYLGGLFVLQSRDYSNYNGLQAQLEKRFSQGFLVTVNYTYSKSLDTRSFDPAFTLVATGSTQSAASTPFDYRAPQLNYAASDFDNTHVINGYYVLDLPFGRGRHYGAQWNRALDLLAGGWQISGDGYWQSGRPLTIYSGSNTFSGSVQTPASCDHCDAHMGHVHKEGTQTYFLTAAQRAQFYLPAPGEFSNIGRNWLRQNATWSTDANLMKSFHTWKEQSLQLRFEVQNLLNNVTYDTMGSQSIQSTVFGRLNAATDGVINSSPRRAQLAAKYIF